MAILVSGFVSLTLTPMLCARYLKGGHEDVRHGRILDAFERGYQASHGFYVRTLDWVMAFRPGTMVFSALILVGTLLLGKVVKAGFIPNADTGQLFGTTETAEGTSFASMVEHPAGGGGDRRRGLEHRGLHVGGGGWAGLDQPGAPLHAAQAPPRPRHELGRDRAVADAEALDDPGAAGLHPEPAGDQHQGAGAPRASTSTPCREGSTSTSSTPPRSGSRRGCTRSPSSGDVTTDLQIRNPQVHVAIDRDRAAAVGISAQQIEQGLYDAYGGRQVSTIFTPTNQYWVVLELLPQYQRDLDALRLLSIRALERRRWFR